MKMILAAVMLVTANTALAQEDQCWIEDAWIFAKVKNVRVTNGTQCFAEIAGIATYSPGMCPLKMDLVLKNGIYLQCDRLLGGDAVGGVIYRDLRADINSVYLR